MDSVIAIHTVYACDYVCFVNTYSPSDRYPAFSVGST